MKTPRITILNRLFWPKRFGGLERVLWRYANAIADSGADVHVITESIDGVPNREVAREGLTVQRHDPPDFGRLWRFAELVQVRWWKHAVQEAKDSDIIWANEPTAAVAAIRAGLADRLLYRPVFCFAGMHNVARNTPDMAHLARTRLSRIMDRFAYKHAGLVIDESHNLRRQHIQYYGRRRNTLVIPNPADAPHLSGSTHEWYGLSPKHFVIGFVGRPGDPAKDLPFFINALTSQPLPDHVRLLMVGGGDHFNQAQQWINDAGLGPRTIWTGDIEDPSPAFAAMHALVLPSRFETFGNVIAEAHAHGLPALARDADFASNPPIYTASSELIDHGDTGFVVDPHNPLDLGGKLVMLANNPRFAADMGQEAKARSTSYTWADAAERYLQALGLQIPSAAPTRIAA